MPCQHAALVRKPYIQGFRFYPQATSASFVMLQTRDAPGRAAVGRAATCRVLCNRACWCAELCYVHLCSDGFRRCFRPAGACLVMLHAVSTHAQPTQSLLMIFGFCLQVVIVVCRSCKHFRWPGTCPKRSEHSSGEC